MKFASSLSDLPLDLDFSPDIIEQVQKDETDSAEARFSRLRNTYKETCDAVCLLIHYIGFLSDLLLQRFPGSRRSLTMWT